MLLRPVTVKTRLTLAVAAVVALAVALAGLVIVVRVDRGEREAVDGALAARASEVSAAAVTSGSLPTDGTFAVRVIAGGRVSAQKGAAVQFSLPVDDGYATVTAADGSQWRSLAQKLKSGAQLQILINLAPIQERHSRNIRTVNVAVLLAALIAAAGARLATELAARRRSSLAPDVTHLPVDDEPIPSAGDSRDDPTSRNGAPAPKTSHDGSAAPSGASPMSAFSAIVAFSPSGATPPTTATAEPPATAEPGGAAQAAGAGRAAGGRHAAAAQAAGAPDPGGADRAGDAAALAGSAAPSDAGPSDAGPSDAGPSDAGPSDAGLVDGSAGEADLVDLFRDPVAALGTGLETLLDNPDMSSTQRHLVLAAVQTEHRRLIELLDALAEPERHA